MGHLLSLGHTRIGLLLGPADHMPSRRKLERARSARGGGGGRDRRRRHRPLAVLARGGAGGRGPAPRARDHRHRLRQRPDGPGRDPGGPPRRARGCPDDVSVVGYDDSALMNCTEPPLTTVRQPIEAMGRMVIELLIAQIGGRRRPPRRAASSSRSWSSAARRVRLRRPLTGSRGHATPIRQSVRLTSLSR